MKLKVYHDYPRKLPVKHDNTVVHRRFEKVHPVIKPGSKEDMENFFREESKKEALKNKKK